MSRGSLRLPLRHDTHHQEGWLNRMHWSVKPAFFPSSKSHKFQAFMALCPYATLILNCEYPAMWKCPSNWHTTCPIHTYICVYIIDKQHTNTNKNSGLHPEKINLLQTCKESIKVKNDYKALSEWHRHWESKALGEKSVPAPQIYLINEAADRC
jgi:hypothetical protein